MNTRLQQFISAENISQSQFADTIGVARASVSHILAGRNKPGFDFIESMSRHFPALNIEWLITGKGRMYKSDSDSAARQEHPIPQHNSPSSPDPDLQGDLFGSFPYADNEPATAQKPAESNAAVQIQARENSPLHQQHSVQQSAKTLAAGGRIQKIIVFYDDNTFQELK